MADFDNVPDINENFDTIKTLLNSIRAQGILNTSDVDKLLSGINTKLEKINTEEDIDLIKIFLSELKQTLDERHSVLVSKFGAIESQLASISCKMAKQPEVYAVSAACPNSAIFNGFPYPTSYGCNGNVLA